MKYYQIVYVFIFLFFSLSLVSAVVVAHSEHDPHTSAEVGQALVESEISCKLLDKEELLAVGTYLYDDKGPAWWLRLRARIGYCTKH
jgi:hypothetical protein